MENENTNFSESLSKFDSIIEELKDDCVKTVEAEAAETAPIEAEAAAPVEEAEAAETPTEEAAETAPVEAEAAAPVEEAAEVLEAEAAETPTDEAAETAPIEAEAAAPVEEAEAAETPEAEMFAEAPVEEAAEVLETEPVEEPEPDEPEEAVAEPIEPAPAEPTAEPQPAPAQPEETPIESNQYYRPGTYYEARREGSNSYYYTEPVKPERSKAPLRISINYLIVALLCAGATAVYKAAGGAKWSIFMILACAIPVFLGFLPNFSIWVARLKSPGIASENLYAGGMASLTLGCVIQSGLDVMGETSPLVKYYWIVGAVLTLLGILCYILQRNKPKTPSPEENTPTP